MKINSKSEKWVKFFFEDEIHFGMEQNGQILRYSGDMFNKPLALGKTCNLSDVTILAPCQPTKMLGLWNNFHERARTEGWDIPPEPLYFIKAGNSYLGHNQNIRRPESYQGPVFFEGELGIVIGQQCAHVSEEETCDYIYGYTCVNDVTAKEILKRDTSFPQWVRAKGFDTFGVFGPAIVTGLDPEQLVVTSTLDGEVLQNYPVSDMIFKPYRLVSLISQDMTLMPGDVITCGTGLGATAMQDGQQIQISINGIGVLSNVMNA